MRVFYLFYFVAKNGLLSGGNKNVLDGKKLISGRTSIRYQRVSIGGSQISRKMKN